MRAHKATSPPSGSHSPPSGSSSSSSTSGSSSSSSTLGSSSSSSTSGSSSSSSTSGSSSSSSTATDDSSPPEDTSVVIASKQQQKPSFNRRGHAKSRLGCFSCKRRRVKCNELRPCCSSCRRLGLRCEYPAQAPGTSAVSGPVTALAPQAPLSGFSLEDLRFYHQFLAVGHPTLPLQDHAVWSQIAAMSHQYDFLAHALLGLGAAHVTQNNGVDYTPSALEHRLIAIKRVNEELGKPEHTIQGADALMGAVTCLLTQTSHLSSTESMVEYLTMARGANLVLMKLIPDVNKSLFSGLAMEPHLSRLQGIMTEQPQDLELVEQIQASVLGIRPLCSGPNETKYMDALSRCISSLQTFAVDTTAPVWSEYVTLWLMPTTLSNQEFADFVAPENHGARLLMAHFFLLDYVVGKSCVSRDLTPKCGGRKNVIISWTRSMAAALPFELKRYAGWALQYCDVLETQDHRYIMSP